MSNNSIRPIDRTLSSDTPLGQSGPGSNGNEGVHSIPQSSSITETSLSDCLVSYPGYSMRGVLPLCIDAVSVFCSSSRLGHFILKIFLAYLQLSTSTSKLPFLVFLTVALLEIASIKKKEIIWLGRSLLNIQLQ